MELLAKLQRRRRAEAALENPGVVEALASLREKSHRAFAASTPLETDVREDAYYMLRALDALERELGRFISDHEVDAAREERRTGGAV